ncbi:hypothetical protein [Anaerobaca lacustris]|uniref:Tetratricopeptide repeat protein n=1 Tax=Anaerobaca lacustris TaxID=3044600 RepID=A0AAW6TX74_9BACT|nr:hypothetical protein [Sedimentisphaerales bacterium M17dextr]
MGEYERVIAEAPARAKDLSPLRYHLFAALTALGQYDKADALFREIIAPGHEARRKFGDWCAKYVFDTLAAGRSGGHRSEDVLIYSGSSISLFIKT